VLTSAVTFSGGEEFAYNLKAQDRATLIGQTTGGGAHPIEIVPLTPPLDIFVPVARSINPVTATNWEAAGVEPDVEVPAEDAFTVAYQLALRHALTTVSAPPTLAEIRAALAGGQPANVIPAS
jgi:C-terminal processing protease CtpA/Prc